MEGTADASVRGARSLKSTARPIILLFLAAILLAPAFLFGPRATDSYVYNFVWTRQFSEAFARGEFYPRWLPASFEGLGSPTFYFYPPVAFWLTGALDSVGFSTWQAVNVGALVMLLASGAAMYAWLSYRGTRPLLGAALYMMAPYHLYEFYLRGALAEFAAFIWLPLLALGLEALPKRWGALLLAVALAGLLLTHLPAAVLTAAFVLAPLAIWRVRLDRSVLLPGAIAGVLGVALAAFYLLPALTLQGHVSSHLLWDDFHRPSYWLLWKRPEPYYLALQPAIALGLVVAVALSRSFWSILAIATAAAAAGIVPFMWDLPLLAQVQFPWRLLMVVEFAAVAAIVTAPPPPALAAASIVVLMIPVLMIGAATANRRALTSDAYLLRAMPDAPEYLPTGFDLAGVTASERRVRLEPYRNLPRGDVMSVSRPGRITFGRAAFPIWQVVKGDKVTPSSGPLITVDATPGQYRIVRRRLWQETVGAAISGLAALLLITAGVLGIAVARHPHQQHRRRHHADRQQES